MSNDIISKVREYSCGILDIRFINPNEFEIIDNENESAPKISLITLDNGKFMLVENTRALDKLAPSKKKALVEKFKKYKVAYKDKNLCITFKPQSLLFSYRTLLFALDVVEENDIAEEKEMQSNIELLKNTCGGMFKIVKYDESRMKMVYSNFKFVCDILVTELEDDKTFMLTCDGSLANKVESMDKAVLERRLDFIKRKYGVVYNKGYFMTIVPLKQVMTEFIELVQAITYVLKG